jgi:hypothetical protein
MWFSSGVVLVALHQGVDCCYKIQKTKFLVLPPFLVYIAKF